MRPKFLYGYTGTWPVEPDWIFRYHPSKIKAGGLMTIVDMLGQSGVLTLLGMGIVFGFLIILIVCVTLVGKLFRALGQGESAGARPAVPSGPATAATTAAVTAAIGAAVTEYRKGEGK
jgi:oxaloacetate decarboxylase gamma subunit